jgi:hypothetical protein
MSEKPKTAQLQIRVSPGQKTAIQRAARQAGMDMSEYVLCRVLSVSTARFQECVDASANQARPSFALAELNSLLTDLTPSELRDAVSAPPSMTLSPFLANYIAAMVEYACVRSSITPPSWVHDIAPLDEPVFGTALQSLRLHLLMNSPPPFRRRNIFIDSTLGQRV